jgi:hypothetical protein
MSVIDCSVHSTAYIPCLQQTGVKVVFRYYAQAFQPSIPEKILKPDEAIALSKAQISIGVVYQYNAGSKNAFNLEQGKVDGRFARDYAANTIKQPAGSAIYFGVDYDVQHDPAHDTRREIDNNIVPHFRGLVAAMAEDKDYVTFDIGVYGAWNVCDRLVKENLVKYTWLSQSTDYGGPENRKKYVQSKAWDLLQRMPRTDLCPGLEYDPNDVKEGLRSFGQFVVPVPNTGTAAHAMVVPN